MKFSTLVVAAALSVAAAGAASASTVYATLVDWSGGGASDGVVNATNRSDVDNALGAPDNAFLSLGLGGWAVFSFGQPFVSPGSVIEVTWGNADNHPESADIWVGTSHTNGTLDLTGWQSAGSIANANAQNPGATVLFPGGPYTFLAIKDTSPVVQGRDGFDVDAVGVSPVPLPAGGLLLLSGLGFLAFRRRK